MNQMLHESGWVELILWLVRRRRRFRVAGDSMRPALEPGDEVLIDPGATPRPGDIAVARHPFVRALRVVKRVEAVEDGRYILKGDNPLESDDSRAFGPVRGEDILGRVTSRLP
ncbi:MAG: nickel-type superoxide dismutase maturation protease [Anaerolineae bacterium]|nr:nickel-type superoxide dismutase maturation protease [Anaerolineae bacterium]